MGLLTPGIGLIFWMTLTFLIVLLILGKWGWPVIIKGLRKREEDIRNSLLAAENAKKEMEKLKAGNEELLAQAREERDNILKEAKQAGNQMIEDAREKAKAEAEKIILQARENINFEKEKAIKEVQTQMAQLSLDIAQKVIEQEVKNPQTSEELIAKQLEKISFK
ncbi:MAG: F0F1 ATP synthase subunit B [Bacteroidales bacterium]|nr:F0F1 ATP synthase subunit B [Bacteroidales bacterium]